VAVAPKPETGESANVAILLGNGRLFRMTYVDRLPRLCGIAAADEIAVYEAVLQSLAERVNRGIALEDLQPMLGSQMKLSDPRALFVEPTDELLERLSKRFLHAPRVVQSHNEDAIIRRSTTRLDAAIAGADRRGVLIADDVRPNSMYEKIERHMRGHRIPKIARAIRGFHRDVLIDSISIESAYEKRDMREVAMRIQEAFYVYDKRLRTLIRQHANTEIRTVGVLHALSHDASEDLLDFRDFVRDTWKQQHANVIDGSTTDVPTAIRHEIDWVRSGAG
jgi:hypothetical protein